ncbi:cellulose synthase [Acrocarpospora sp. B8E8]|uniref:cellulose synthase n=1 Tax=Acrocarpospora sp. B8E8 TaxID=3153572 RepID=UPI00325DB098
MSFEQIAWLPLCAGLTAAGVALAYVAFRRRGVSAGLRMTAWALLPLAAYLTGALKTIWNIGTALVSFATGLVFSPAVWAGVALAGISVLLFFVSGGIRGRTLAKFRAMGRTGKQAPAGATGAESPTRPLPAAKKDAPKPVANKPASDDFSDVEDILKKHGIS